MRAVLAAGVSQDKAPRPASQADTSIPQLLWVLARNPAAFSSQLMRITPPVYIPPLCLGEGTKGWPPFCREQVAVVSFVLPSPPGTSLESDCTWPTPVLGSFPFPPTLSFLPSLPSQVFIESRCWFKIGKGVQKGCILSPCLFNFYAEYITWDSGLDAS